MNRKTMSGIMLTLLLTGMSTLAFNIQPVKAEPTTWTVDDDGPANFSTIQEAIDSPEVVDGDTIFVFSGTYYEHVTIDKSLSLIGEDTSTTIIDSSGTGTVIHVTASNVVISSFTIRNSGKEYWSMGIFLDGIGVTGCTIMNNNVSNNGGFGIFACWANNNSISNNLVTFNGRDGIRVDVSRNILTNNVVNYNGWLGAYEGDGIFLYAAFDCLIEGNTASSNRKSGIAVTGMSSNITIRDNMAENNGGDGIFHYGSLACSTEANTISNNGVNGISIYLSNDNSISHNTITSNNWHGINLYSSSNNSMSGNNITENANGITLSESSNNTISENSMTANSLYGIELAWSSNYNIISGNDIATNREGIWLWETSSNTVSGNSIAANDEHGIILYWSSDNSISGNTATNNMHGVSLGGSSDNMISGNRITQNNLYGVELFGSSSNYNRVFGNNITNNKFGIWLWETSDNSIYHNNFISNIQQVYSYVSTNVWDDGYPSGGDYWSDYEEKYPNAEELDSLGIWDTPYLIDLNNQDSYPLMEPWTPIDELKAEIEELGSEGEIDNQGIVTSLIAKLNVAQKLVEDGKIDQAENILNAFINEVQAQSGKHITPEAAELLIESTGYILSHL